MSEDTWFLIKMLACIVGVIVAVVAGCAALDRWACGRVAGEMDREYRWSLAACMIKTSDGQWMPLNTIRTVTP